MYFHLSFTGNVMFRRYVCLEEKYYKGIKNYIVKTFFFHSYFVCLMNIYMFTHGVLKDKHIHIYIFICFSIRKTS